jgi:septum site-determining protein MinC
MAAIPDYEQAGELKIGQVGIANLRVRTLDVDRLAAEMRDRVRGAPKLFERAAVILDFGGLSDCPAAADVRALADGLRDAGVLPVGIAYGTSAIEAMAREVGLPLLAKFRAAYESASAGAAVGAASAASSTSKSATAAKPVAAEAAPTAAPAKAAAGSAGEPGMMQLAPVRSGQQVYAQNRDLTVCAMVGAGAEVIADGSIHIYGALRGRALAGATGLETARIFCRDFNAELVAVAGTYKVLEEIPKNLIGKPVQIYLRDGKLHIEELA